MTHDTDIPQGYKATALGVIPQKWEVKFLGDLLSRCTNGLTYDVSITCGIPVTRIETISTGEINYAKVGYIPNESGYETFRMQKGDILYSHINSLSQIGKVAYYKGDKEIYHGMNLLLLRANESLDKQYLYYTLLTDHMRHMAQVIAKPAVNQASISTSDLKRVKIAVPPLAEQRKIAEVLGVWDEAIEKQARLIEKLALRKRALMQRLLSAKLRLPGFSEPCKKIKLGDICERVTRKNIEDYQNVMTISAQRGFVAQTDFFNKSVASETLESYYLVFRDEFCYNKSYSNGYPMGAIKRLSEAEKAVVTSLYICFNVKPGTDANIDYLSYYFDNGGLNRGLTKIANEGGRAHGLLNVTPKDFFGLSFEIPSLKEQTAIAKVLTAADREIELAKEKLERLRRQKRGLMQQLLTGKKRVKYGN